MYLIFNYAFNFWNFPTLKVETHFCKYLAIYMMFTIEKHISIISNKNNIGIYFCTATILSIHDQLCVYVCYDKKRKKTGD